MADEYKIGPDGEPEPIGNDAQRAASQAVALTFAKPKNPEEKKDKPVPTAQAQVQPKIDKQAPTVKEVKVAPEASDQEKANQAYKDAVKGHTQVVGNPEIKAQGSFIPPAETPK